ncbi:hypothetical protein I79_006583 [Cricetulus griseus]|uniref:Uncharacterized protein n=1 Tax=Cricetulus griseus TaxID=10029 RepID=G3H883_CRIGR|nr:hypothetical protein I79_006583 [Cricetulus griseus]
MSQQLRTLAALPEDPGSILNTTWWPTTISNSSSRGFCVLFWPPKNTAHLWCIKIHQENRHIN